MNMYRRDFLHPRRLAQTAGQVLAVLDEVPAPPPAPPEEVPLLRAAHPAMATRFELLLPCGTPNALALAEASFAEIDYLEQQLTVYRDDSEVSELNRLAPDEPVRVEEGLFHLLTLAKRLTEETDG